jgi:hypothetical protein
MFETINEQMQKFHWQYRVDITKFKKRISRKGIAKRSDMIKGVAMILCWGGPDFKPQTDDR